MQLDWCRSMNKMMLETHIANKEVSSLVVNSTGLGMPWLFSLVTMWCLGCAGLPPLFFGGG